MAAAGDCHSLAVMDDGSLVGFGGVRFGQASVPDFGPRKVVQAAAGDRHSLALLDDGSLVGFGADDLLQASVPDFGARKVSIGRRLDPAVVRAILLAGQHGVLRGVAAAQLLGPIVSFLTRPLASA